LGNALAISWECWESKAFNLTKALPTNSILGTLKPPPIDLQPKAHKATTLTNLPSFKVKMKLENLQ
jgi:hypothetical protein